MLLRAVEITQFRCINAASFEPDPDTSFVIGPNGSGKTSLLEAIYYLAHGRSFRTSQVLELSTRGAGSFSVRVATTTDQGVPLPVAVQWTEAGGSILKIGNQRARGFAEAAAAIPVRIVDADAHLLVEGSPAERRRFLDWGVFHVEPTFMEVWRRYQRALKQRNVALRSQLSARETQIWDAELSNCGERIGQLRGIYLDALLPFIRTLVSTLLDRQVTMKLRQGWLAEQPLATALERAWENDQRRGTTTVGPHRADLIIEMDGDRVAPQVSRGQQKLLAAAMNLGQLEHAAVSGANRGCLLIDDPSAELDVDNLKKLLAVVAAVPAQRIITGTENTLATIGGKASVFHVKQGEIQRVL